MSKPKAIKPRNSDLKQKENLVAKLNEDLAGELGAVIQYITYAAKVI